MSRNQATINVKEIINFYNKSCNFIDLPIADLCKQYLIEKYDSTFHHGIQYIFLHFKSIINSENMNQSFLHLCDDFYSFDISRVAYVFKMINKNNSTQYAKYAIIELFCEVHKNNISDQDLKFLEDMKKYYYDSNECLNVIPFKQITKSPN